MNGKVWKDFMQHICNEENECGHNVEGVEAEGLVVRVSRYEVLQPLNETETGKDFGTSDILLKFIAAGGEEGL